MVNPSLSYQIRPSYKALVCRATWRVREEDVELATLQIASKRLKLDDVIKSMKSVHFFFSCITAVSTNEKRSSTGQSKNEAYPAIAYFIVYTPSEECNQDTFFARLHNEDLEPNIKVNVI